MKNIKITLVVAVLIIMTAFNTLQAEPFMSDIVRAELEQVNNSNKTVVPSSSLANVDRTKDFPKLGAAHKNTSLVPNISISVLISSIASC